MDVEQVRAQTLRWLEQVVIGLNLCPFAAGPHRRGQVHVQVCLHADPEAILREALDVVDAMLGQSHDPGTTLLVVPRGLEALERYLEVAADLEELLARAGADAMVQVATFHPDYLFQGEPPEALSHYTNRSPYPILHLIWEEHVTQAVAAYGGDASQVFEANIARMEALGAEGIAALWAKVRG